MSTDTSVRNLQIIVGLDSLSYGLIYGFISPYILELQGSHVSVGILTVGILIAELLSPEVIKIFTHLHGRRYALFFILNTAFVTHLMLVLTSSYWFTILVRILFTLINQSQNICLELLLGKAQNDETREKLHRNYSILSGSGYILGPILSGYLFEIGFGYAGILSALLALANVNLLMNVSRGESDVDPEHTDKSVLQKASEKVIENIEEFKKCNFRLNWDMLLLKYLFASSVIIFFSKFTQILKYNYKAGSEIMGCTIAYINILVFAATYYVTIAKRKIDNYPTIFVSEVCFLLNAILMLIACYAPYYELYMLLLLPIIFLRTLILSLWKELFSERKNESLIKLNNPASAVAGLTVPIFFGVICNQIAHNAVILFSCVPMLLCWVILRSYSRYLKIDLVSTEDKDL